MASESSEREKVYELFERAVKDYICKLLMYAIKLIVLHSVYGFLFLGRFLPSDIMQKLDQKCYCEVIFSFSEALELRPFKGNALRATAVFKIF